MKQERLFQFGTADAFLPPGLVGNSRYQDDFGLDSDAELSYVPIPMHKSFPPLPKNAAIWSGLAGTLLGTAN